MLLRIIAISLLTAFLIPPQSNQHPDGNHSGKRRFARAPRNASSSDYLHFVARLREAGASVRTTRERVQQPFFSVSARIININDEGVQVFIYSNPSIADEQAKLISPNGMTVGTTKPSWMAPPHFFQNGKLLVLYVGANESVLKVLQTTLGSKVAGS